MTEPKLRPDEMYEYEVAFLAGYNGEDFETDSLATMRGFRDGCECRKGDPKKPADDEPDDEDGFEEEDDDGSGRLGDEARRRIEDEDDKRQG